MITFVYASKFLCSRQVLFDFHEQPIGFQTLVGAAPGVKVLEPPPSLEVGSMAKMLVPVLPLVWSAVWVAEHTAYKKNEFFEDTQKQGPFRYFRHRHIFLRVTDSECILRDEIELDFFFLVVSKWFILPFLLAQFKARHKATAKALNTIGEKLQAGYLP